MPGDTSRAPPLSWQNSQYSRPTISDTLPDEVENCLENARFLHLATCAADIPHVSLMNYTYLPSNSAISRPRELSTGPTIIMTSNPSSKKTLNLINNPNVSLLVHDWISHRPSALTSEGRERSPTGARLGNSSLANMLMQMNSSSISSISCNINGEARVLDPGSEAERWCRQQHLENNTFMSETQGDAGQALFGTSPSQLRTDSGDGGRASFIDDEDVRVVIVKIRDGRISDWKGQVKDWVISDTTPAPPPNAAGDVMVNGMASD